MTEQRTNIDVEIDVASNFQLAAIVVENNVKLITTKAKNIFDENFLTNFLTQFKDLHVQTSKGKTNRNCIQLSFTLEQICSIYICMCKMGRQIGLVVVERNTFQYHF